MRFLLQTLEGCLGFDGSDRGPGQYILGDAAENAEGKPNEHQPETRTDSRSTAHATTKTKPNEEYQKGGNDQDFEPAEDGKSQAKEGEDALPYAEKHGKRTQQWNEDCEQE